MSKKHLPSYLKIGEELKDMIDEGIVKVGDKLPSENLMAKKFNVSRETFRSAVKLLQEEGRLHVKHGVGTFVANSLPKIPNSLEKLTSITSMINDAGLTEGEQRESIGIVGCTEEWASILNISVGTPVVVHERIRTANEEPVVFSVNIIPHQFIGDSIQQVKEIGSLIKFLESTYQIKITKADSEIIVPLHTDPNCKRLLVKPETQYY